ncbi:ABC transporter [Streptomyces sp. NPDC058371]|uniref:ABC transporter n=1 Tax=Streptomyces sp. NPDC058371 TaxID=3346463 RepID=UPI003665D3CB
MTWDVIRPVWRSLPWGALGTGAGAGLLLAGAPRGLFGQPDPWLTLNFLRAAALAGALGLTFLLDDPARHTTAAVPVRRPVRVALRVGLVAPLVVGWWAVALALVPAGARPPVGAVSLEAAAVVVLALAVAAAGVRFSDEAEPGAGAAAALLGLGVSAPLLVPERWTPFVAVDDARWGAAHLQWAALLIALAAAAATCTLEPCRRRPLYSTGGTPVGPGGAHARS